MISGCVNRKYVAPDRVVAVVSEPARTRMNAVADNFSTERFYNERGHCQR